jgi:hypothetical protein
VTWDCRRGLLFIEFRRILAASKPKRWAGIATVVSGGFTDREDNPIPL